MPHFLLLAVASANACGMFGDGCDEYGQTGGGVGFASVGLLASLLALCVGTGLAIAGSIGRMRRRRRPPADRDLS